MCGICGVVNKRKSIPDKELIISMLDRLYHRGPDGRGLFRDERAMLGHTRLSIIDLEGGTQPLSNEDGSLWISFNGEIFNYLELRDELISLGHVFKTNSDTEVIVHSWEAWGENCFRRFNGQWAIALWDRKSEELILSRDRHGIRPLYYTENSDRLLFASEIKSLFADETIDRSLSPAGLQETFTFWGPIAPATAFLNVFELESGHYGVFRDNQLKCFSYWDDVFPSIEDSHDERKNEDLAQELKEKLIESSRLRFERSDVPVGSYLSGGIDSSICASIVSKYAKEGLKTFSIQFSSSRFDESRYQNIMVEHLGTDHESFTVEPSDIGAVFPDVVRHTERPILRTAPAPLFLLSKLVRESGYKVVVTGEGADEVLGGYDIFREAYVRKDIALNGHSDKTEECLERLYPWMGDSFKKTPAFTRSFFSKNLNINDPALSHRTRWDNSRLLMPLLSKEMARSAKEAMVVSSFLERLPESFSDWDYLAKAQWLEYRTLLSGYILSAQGDRMLMANSVEGRFPFLDVNLVEFANSLPSDTKLRTKDLTEKFLLKEAFKAELPRDIIERSKQPYQSPNGLSFFKTVNGSNRLLDWVEEVKDPKLIGEAGIYNPTSVNKLFEKCLKPASSELNYGDNIRILSILSTMLLYRDFVKDNLYSGPPRNRENSLFEVDLIQR